MNEEEMMLIEKYMRLSPSCRRIALAQISTAVELEEKARNQYGSLPGSGYWLKGSGLVKQIQNR